mmetsp:Transcript_9524/g.14332  ORF Transcript_9524/g.14332 Transcript_9524/m.14332 type:complete len:85 (-) Transcript_9524:612-866(-)
MDRKKASSSEPTLWLLLVLRAEYDMEDRLLSLVRLDRGLLFLLLLDSTLSMLCDRLSVVPGCLMLAAPDTVECKPTCRLNAPSI